MFELFRSGGVGMIPTALFGLLLLGVSLVYAARPDKRWLPLQVSLAITTLSVGSASFVAGLMATTQHIEGAGEHAGLLGAVGFGESLGNVALALVLIALSSIATTAGTARDTRRRFADA